VPAVLPGTERQAMNRHAFVLGTTAGTLASTFPAAAQTHTSVSIATVASDPLALPLYAQQLGSFAKAGLDVTTNDTMNGAAITSAVASGAVDIGGSNLSTIVVAFKKGVPITLIAPAGIYSANSPVMGIIVPKASPITTAKDLEGKIVAVSPLRSISEFAPSEWIEKNGGDYSKVKFIELPFGEMEAAMLQGRIAAAVLTEPYYSQSKSTSRLLAFPYAAVGPTFLTSAFFASTAFVKAHRDTVDRFAAVIRQTAAWANKNQTQSGAILAAMAKLDPSIVAKMSRVIYADSLTPAMIQPNIDLLAQFKVIDRFEAADMIYTSI
jgi:NitT/TauT family transport system substrate-binding protein